MRLYWAVLLSITQKWTGASLDLLRLFLAKLIKSVLTIVNFTDGLIGAQCAKDELNKRQVCGLF